MSIMKVEIKFTNNVSYIYMGLRVNVPSFKKSTLILNKGETNKIFDYYMVNL